MPPITTDSPPEELVRTVNSLRERVDQFQDVEKTANELRTLVQGIDERMAKDAISRDVPTGNSELMRFQGREIDVKRSERSYVKNDRGAVRMLGHKGADGVYRPGLLDGRAESEYQYQLQDLATRRNIVKMALRSQGLADHTPEADDAIVQHLRRAPGELAALRDVGERIWAGSAGLGIEIVPETLLPGLERKIELMPSVAQLFATRVAPANGRQAYVSGRLRPYKGSVPTTDDPSNQPALSSITAADASILPVEMAVAAQLHRDIEEDGVLSSADLIEQDLMWSLVYGEADCIINGHAAANQTAHQDDLANWGGRSLTAVTAATTDHRLCWDGLRRLAIAKSAASSYASVTGTDVVTGLMADIGGESLGQSVILMSYEYFLGVAIKWADFQTWDKVGPNATLLNGIFGTAAGALPHQVGFVAGVPICLTACLTGDLNASGVYDDTTTTKTGALIVNRSRYTRWIKKNGTVETDVNIRNNTRDLVARRRLTFKEAIPGLTSEVNVAYAYNLPKA